MRYDLNSPAKILSPPFLLDDGIINTTGSIIVHLGHNSICVPLVMSHIQICLSTVICHIDFSMLKRVHGTRINIYIRIQFLKCHRHSTAFK